MQAGRSDLARNLRVLPAVAGFLAVGNRSQRSPNAKWNQECVWNRERMSGADKELYQACLQFGLEVPLLYMRQSRTKARNAALRSKI